MLLSDFPTVQYPIEIHRIFGSNSFVPRYLKPSFVKESAAHNASQPVIATARDKAFVGYDIGNEIIVVAEVISVLYPHCIIKFPQFGPKQM